MKIVIFYRLDCFPDKYINSEINTCITNVIKRALNRKHGGEWLEAILSICVQEKNRENKRENDKQNYEESSRRETI